MVVKSTIQILAFAIAILGGAAFGLLHILIGPVPENQEPAKSFNRFLTWWSEK